MSIQVFMDGTNLSDPMQTGFSTRRFSGLSNAEFVIPTAQASGGIGSKMKVVVNGELEHHGRVLHVSDELKEDTMYTTFQSWMPLEIVRFRPARDGAASPTPGNLITPSVFKRVQFGPEIIAEMLGQSEEDSDPNLGEGPLGFVVGTVETGGSNVSGAPTNFPMTISECISLLVSTGELDVVETPIDSGGNMSSVGLHNGGYGVDRSGEVVFNYAMGLNNCVMRQIEDGHNMCNKLYYNFGPRPSTTRYKANITADDPCLPAGPLGTVISRRDASRASYGVRMDFREFDVGVLRTEDHGDEGGECNEPQDETRILYRRRWLQESFYRAIPRRMVHITPQRNYALTAFGVGDLIGAQAGAAARGGFGFQKQRVYERTVAWDSDVAWLNEIGASPNYEGL